MKKYIAAVESADGSSKFKIYYDGEKLITEDGEEISDGQIGHDANDKQLVEMVYAMYGGAGWEINDCIEYEEENRLAELRIAKGLSQTQLAKAAGINGMMVSRLERGERLMKNTTLDTAIKLADALGVDDLRELL